MNRLRLLALVGGLLAVTLAVTTPTTQAQNAGEWGTIKGKVIVTKAIPPAAAIAVNNDKEHCLSKGPLVSEAVMIGKDKGLQNVIVWLRPATKDRKDPFPKDKIHPDLAKAPAKAHTIDQPCCQFIPRVVAAKTGDTLEIKNSAPVAHNINYSSDAATFNVTLPPGKSYKVEQPLTAQSTPIPFKCDIHQWMQGRMRVFDHPYFAITDAEGNFVIKDAPAGDWNIVYWHENGFHKGKDGVLGFPVKVTAGKATDVEPLDFVFP